MTTNFAISAAQGNIKEWNKKVGDEIAPGDVLAEIETDKATVAYEMHEEGYVAAILFEEGAKNIDLGTAIAIIVEKKEDIASFADYKGGDATPAQAAPAEAAPAQAAPAQAASSSPAASYPDHIPLEMPNLSPTMEKVSALHAPLTHLLAGEHPHMDEEGWRRCSSR